MKAFSFGLEKVLNLRKFYEDEAKIELGRAMGVLADLESRLYAVGRERVKAAAAQFAPENSASMLQQYMFYIIRLDNLTEELLKEITLAEMKVEEAREAFLEASKERKVLDKLKDKRQKEYHKVILTEETKTLDDIGTGVRE
jgi:flagellar FliJ protein